MIRFRRRNTVWLAALGVLIIFALIAAPVPAALQAILLSIFALAAVGSLVEMGPERETIIDALQRAPMRRKVTPQAKEAIERAKSRGGYYSPGGITLMDLGLIAVQTGHDGLAMRRTRNISKDDDGVRPFITLYVHPEEAERHAVIRFEMYNHLGEQQYIYEMNTYLRDGELNILADHHLPLAGNINVDGTGDWDMRVYMDGNLIGMHDLFLSPSVDERRRRLAGEQASTNANTFTLSTNDVIVQEEPQEVPLSIGELINKQEASKSRSTYRRS